MKQKQTLCISQRYSQGLFSVYAVKSPWSVVLWFAILVSMAWKFQSSECTKGRTRRVRKRLAWMLFKASWTV